MNRNKIKLCLFGAIITSVTVMLLGYFFAPESSTIMLGLIGAALGVISALTLVNQIDKLQARVEQQVNSMTKLDTKYDADNREFFLVDLDESFVRAHQQEVAKSAKLDRTTDAARIGVSLDGKTFGFVDQKFNDTMIPVLDQYAADITIRIRVHTEEKLHVGLSVRSKKTAAREALKKAFEACAEL